MSRWEIAFTICYSAFLVYLGLIFSGYVKHPYHGAGPTPADVWVQRVIYTAGDMVWCTVSHFVAPTRFDEKRCGSDDDDIGSRHFGFDVVYESCCRLAAQRSAPPRSHHWLPRVAWWVASWVVDPMLDGIGLFGWLTGALCWPLDALIGDAQ